LWTYDKVGNRLTEQVGTAAVSKYTYDIADQVMAISGPGATSFTCNANGDQLTAGTTASAYNTARQTTSVNTGTGAVPYAYDGDGNLTRIGANGAATDQHWDVVGGMAMLVGVKPQSNPYWTRYSNAGSLPVSTKFDLSQESSFYLTDGVGSVTNLTAKGTGTANGFVSATYRYTPFGVSRSAVTAQVPGQNDYATTNTALFYTGQQRMANGDYNMRARPYNPTRGAFTQTDPMPYGAGTAIEGSYVYGRNNPLLMTDPTGLRATSCYNGGRQPGACAQKVEFLWGVVQGNPYSNELYDEIYVQKKGVLPADVMVAPNVGCHPNSIGCQLFMGPQGDEYQSMVVLGVPGRGMTTAVRASQLREIAGRNRVVIETPSGRMTVDLEGAAHFEKSLGRDVPTPHVKFETKHVGPNGRVTYTSGPVRDATYADLRLVERKLAGR
jgi:RHS repeat-associated protein